MAFQQLLRMGLLLAALAMPALADSDGYFCTTSAYLAYETRFPSSSPHQLHVVSLEPPLSEQSRRSVDLPDFQVHGLLCFDSEVLVLGWDSLFTVTMAPAKALGLRSEKLAYSGYRPSLFENDGKSANLGSLAAEQTIPLTTSEANFLLVTRMTPTGEPCELRVISSLEQVGHEGLVRFTLQLYDGKKGMECGE
jgi:hypothetical protein